MRNFKRVLVLADLHCGNRAGLTPPEWQFQDKEGERGKWGEIQRKLYDWYLKTVKSLQPIDVLLANGDLIDGKGERSGGTELAIVDPQEQTDAASECLRAARADQTFICYGTPYHAGKDTDYERLVAKDLDASIDYQQIIDVNDVVIDMKHFVSGSQVPHGQWTSAQRERVWHALWVERGLKPKANIFIRSHVHAFRYGGDAMGIVIQTPGLQMFSKFGASKCSSTFDVGMISIDCQDGRYSWTPYLHDLKPIAKAAVKV